MASVSGVLCSQVGYDLDWPMRIVVRATHPEFMPEESHFQLRRENSANGIIEGPVVEWGHLWDAWWWVADFSACEEPGRYYVELLNEERTLMASDPFKVDRNLLWNETWRPTSVEHLDKREELAPDHNGWQDCGASLREVNSHATMVIGLCDLLQRCETCVSKPDAQDITHHIIQGCDYLALCQDKAGRQGGLDGAIVHEFDHHAQTIPGDVSLCVVALARASQVLAERNRSKAGNYRERAAKAFDWLKSARPYGSEGFDPVPHGIGMPMFKPGTFMTRDLAAFCWAAVELCRSGKVGYREDAVRYARAVIKRQIPEAHPEFELYGHFHTFGAHGSIEKTCVHHGVGHDCGAVFPHYVQPLVLMCNLWPDHPDYAHWQRTVESYAYGFLIPACSTNPFYLMPNGCYHREGLLTFSGLWHGMNAAYGLTAALALDLETVFQDRSFRAIATGNLQWIAGLNAGITQESLAGCEKWRDDIPPDSARSYSMIYGIGARSAGSWTNIRGTICNGFDVDEQFKFNVKPTARTDGPHMFTDEDWITHNGAWLSAISRLRART